MSDALEQAKKLFDEELDKATQEIIKRWKTVYKKSSPSNLNKLVDKLKKHNNGRTR